MRIIGITGTLGAGKGTVVDYLKQEYGFVHFSVREFLKKEVAHRGMPQNRDSYTFVANELRAQHTPSYITDQLYCQAEALGKNAVIESIRTPGEIDALEKKPNFQLWAVDAKPAVRYDRVVLRNSETDHIDYDTFLSNERREMFSDDPNKQNLSVCIQRAKAVLHNDGTREELYAQVDAILKHEI